MTITFDGENIMASDIVIRYLKHEGFSDRAVSIIPFSREDGGILVSEKFQEKRIQVQGVITETTEGAGDLEANIDSLAEILSRVEKNLVFTWNGGTRKCIATCVSFVPDRDHYHVRHCPFNAEFIVASGEERETSTTLALDEEAETTTTPVDDAFTIAGSKAPKPVITIEGNSWPTGCLGIEFQNLDTGEKIAITNSEAWGTTSSIEIDCEEKSVTHTISSVDYSLDFYGLFPAFKIGTNNFRLTVGDIVNQKSLESSVSTGRICIDQGSGEKQYLQAQSFVVPYTNDTFQSIQLWLEKFGTPGDLTVEIREDNNGEPTGGVVATMTFTAGDIATGSFALYKSSDSSPYSLSANTKYWIVCSCASEVAGNNFYYVGITPDAAQDYPNGIPKQSATDGATWATGSGIDRSLAFKLLYGGLAGTSATKVTVEYTKTYL